MHTDIVREIATQEIASWPIDRPVAIHTYLRAMTLRIILRTIFGHESAQIRELHAKLFAMFSVTASLVLQEPQLRRLPGWRNSWTRFLTERAEVEKIVLELIQKEAHAHAYESGMLSMLLEAYATKIYPKSTEQIHDALMSVILAGHETTASELAWALQLLAHNKAVAERLTDELDDGDDIYLTATIQEVLRDRPVFLFTIPRVVHKAFELAATTYNPPVLLVGCIHLMHHDPLLYPEPHRFWPERFIDGAPQPELWMPWGGGRKRCPGYHLAMLEMSTVLRAVFTDLLVEPVGRKVERARWRSVIVTPGQGSRIIFRPRLPS
jgi:hypothetical protein